MKLKLFICLILILNLTACFHKPSGPSFDEQTRAKEFVDQGVLHLRAKDYDRAESSFKLAAELADLPAAWDGLGSVEFKRGNYDKAEIFFVKAFRKDNTYINALGNLALLCEKRGDRERARILYRDTLAQEPENLRARNNYAGLVYDLSGDKQQTRSELLKAEAILPHPIIVKNLNWIEEE